MVSQCLNQCQLEVLKKKKTDWVEFYFLHETVSLDDKIRHLFVVIADAKQLMYNKIYPLIISKQKKVRS